MEYAVELKPKAIKDLRGIDKTKATRIADALERLQTDLHGDVKKLTSHTPEYRLRVGDYRVLFEVAGPNRVVVYRIIHRREAYRYGGTMELHPRILEKNGKKEFVILPYEEFEYIENELSDYYDLKDLREAKQVEQDAETHSLGEVREELGL
ncbi:MAG: type II toxin-antitoxin system RelE family toxin [Spirochaetaceae bacterium]